MIICNFTKKKFVSNMKKNHPLIIAHRGESFDAPENTLASINLAWNRNDDAVEIDIHLSKDNKIIVIHDANTKRTAGPNKKISKMTLKEIKNLDAGSWKNNKWKNEKIPTLKEVLITVPENKKLIIEIKSGIKIIPFLKDEILKSKLANCFHQIEFISFSYSTITEIKKNFPKHNALYLVNLDYTWYNKIFSPPVEKLIAKVKKGNLNGLDVWAGNLLTERFADKVKTNGLLLYVWTVNNIEKAKKLVNLKIDGITTDKAWQLKKELYKIL